MADLADCGEKVVVFLDDVEFGSSSSTTFWRSGSCWFQSTYLVDHHIAHYILIFSWSCICESRMWDRGTMWECQPFINQIAKNLVKRKPQLCLLFNRSNLWYNYGLGGFRDNVLSGSWSLRQVLSIVHTLFVCLTRC